MKIDFKYLAFLLLVLLIIFYDKFDEIIIHREKMNNVKIVHEIKEQLEESTKKMKRSIVIIDSLKERTVYLESIVNQNTNHGSIKK